MNEKDTKELLEKSIIETSGNFSDKLMHRIEAEELEGETSVWSFKSVFSVLVVVVAVVSFVLYKYLESGIIFFENRRTPIFAAITILLLLAINYVLKLYEEYNMFKSNT